MNTVLMLAASFLSPIVLALLFALWDDNFSARHKRHAALIARMERDTDALWDAYCDCEGLPDSARSDEIRKRAQAR